MNPVRRWPSALVCILCCFFGARASAGIIDSYTAVEGGNADTVSVATSGSDTLDFNISPTVTDPVGSRRRLSVSQFAVGQSSSLSVDGGVATYGSSSTANSDWTITYGVGSPLNYDATAGGLANAFKLTFDSFSTGFEFRMTVFSTPAGGSSNGGAFQALGSTVIVPFSGFENAGTIDFSNLSQMNLRIRNLGFNTGGSATLTLFETVPEPATGTLLGVALLAVVGVSLRQRRRQLAGRHR